MKRPVVGMLRGGVLCPEFRGAEWVRDGSVAYSHLDGISAAGQDGASEGQASLAGGAAWSESQARALQDWGSVPPGHC